VYYGFWPYAMWEEQPHLRELRRQIEPLLNESNGVHYYGMRSEAELAEAYAAAGWYAYPSDKPETSGIALMKAQACGCVPLTSGQRKSALTETVGEWDAGPKGRAGKIADDAQWQKEFVAAMIAAARRPQSEMVEYRRKMKEQARKRFSWATVARQWTEEYFGAAGGAAAATPPPPTPAPPAATKAPPTARRARARAARPVVDIEVGLGAAAAQQAASEETAADETAAEEERLERELVELRTERRALEARVRSLEALYG